MSGFTALNVEPEDTFEEEVDDTREIQLEEAFKLYQNALKLHSQGPEYFREAEDAYAELLKSEVFNYPEVVTDFAHDELDDETVGGVAQHDAGALSLLPSNAAESSASSIPQLIYLAFKNRGQFLLDVARHQRSNRKGSRWEICQYYAKAGRESLKEFAKALERDDTDLDLWKKAARVADVLSSQRIARFCLESVLAGDDQDADQMIDLSGLDEAFAAGELEEVVSLVQDDLSRLQSSDIRPKTQLSTILKKTNDPYRFLPKRAKMLEYIDDRCRPLGFGVAQIELEPESPDLLSLGDAIHQTIKSIQDGSRAFGSSSIIRVNLPNANHINEDQEMNPPSEAAQNEHGTTIPSDDEAAHKTSPSLPDVGAKAESSPEKEPPPEHDSTNLENSASRNKETLQSLDDPDTIEVRTGPTAREEGSAIPSRKRSTTAAGNEEPEGRTKSKRLRARESMADLAAQEEEAAQEDPQYFLDQLAIFNQADQAVFDVVNALLSSQHLKLYLTAEKSKQAFWTGVDPDNETGNAKQSARDLAILGDLRLALLDWSDDKSQALFHGHGNQDFVEKSAGMSLFLQHSKPTASRKVEPGVGSEEVILRHAISRINAEATNVYDAATYWLAAILTDPKRGGEQSASSYMQDTWSADLKKTVVQLSLAVEAQLYEACHQNFLALTSSQRGQGDPDIHKVETLLELVETIFELFFDLNAAIKGPVDTVAKDTQIAHADRLNRWAGMASDFTQLYLASDPNKTPTDPFVLRFLWTSTLHATLGQSDVDKTHVVVCLEELKAVLQGPGIDPIHLPNNTAMPVISEAAIEQELSRLKTLDFFTSIFDSDNSDPVAVIEKLEPILELTPREGEDGPRPGDAQNDRPTQTKQLITFLESGDAALKLFLWRRLQNAYTAISYIPKVVSCLLRAIETSVAELYAGHVHETEPTNRQISMLKWLRDIDELMVKVLSKVLAEPTAFECVDEVHLQSSVEAVTAVMKLIYGFVIYDDSVRVGQTAGPQLKGAAVAKMFEKSRDRFKEMLVRAWTLLYLLLKEATVQNPSSYPRAADDLAEYLSTVHHSLGVRQWCRHANKSFIKLVRSELTGLGKEHQYAGDMSQVFFDLYQLRFASGLGDVDHGCPTENLDRKTAWSLIPTIMRYAGGLNVKDLGKTDIKATIEKIQQALGVVKSGPALLHNKRTITAYLKSPIFANDLYKSLRGIGDLPTRPVSADTQVAASTGWYFLLGNLTLAKYKAVKRVNPTPTDDLETAAGFFRQDLDHDITNWESWYRLAQVYDAKIEDDLIWNSTKLNDSRGDIALLERQAIHCYIMSTSMAMRYADDKIDTAHKIEDMLAEFATRLYASSRPPMNMEAFKTDKHVRHMSSIVDQTMSKQPFHPAMGEYPLWRFAAHLLGIKLTDRPKPWTAHYTRAKCLWKMFSDRENRKGVSADDVLEAIIESIEALPKKEKTNEPVLEPHFKLVSVVHKMVRRHALTYAQAQEYMQASRYAQGVQWSEDEDGVVDWISYVLDILKRLGHADKSHWHHRITDRAAHVIYDDEPNLAGALGAKHQFAQQIFTKTMTMQVWKPENERPGRHYVYTGRYVSFFVHILEQLGDRANLDALVRRLRRKTTDFLDHAKVWEEVVTTYVRLLRRVGQIPEARERALFDGMNFEEFTKKSEALEKWSHDLDTSSVYLDIMRDAIDLKRLNNSLMKGPMVDDLIGDSYACLYEEYLKQLPAEEQANPDPPLLPQGTFINMTTGVAASSDEEGERARLSHVLRAQGDSTADGPLALTISAPVGLGLQNTSSFSQPPHGPAAVEAPRVPGKPGRTKTVTRREIQRKAEAAIVKPPPIKTPILSKRLTVEIPSKGGVEEERLESPVDKRLVHPKDDDMDGSRSSSRRGSMQESADGEDSGSEASEREGRHEQTRQQDPQDPDQTAEGGNANANADEEGDERDERDEEAGEEEGEEDEDDEEMQDAEDEAEVQVEMEIPDSQDHEKAAHKGTFDGDEEDEDDEDEEFHEAREDIVEAAEKDQ